MRKGFLRPANDKLLVGVEDKSKGYSGPVAEVWADNDWLWIVTDSHEGVAMMNIEALPFLRRALARIAKQKGPDVPAEAPATD